MPLYFAISGRHSGGSSDGGHSLGTGGTQIHAGRDQLAPVTLRPLLEELDLVPVLRLTFGPPPSKHLITWFLEKKKKKTGSMKTVDKECGKNLRHRLSQSLRPQEQPLT